MKKKLKGVVISDKMDKTIVVKIERTVTHPIYHKKYKVSKNYKVHDENNSNKIGDIVEIEETKPVSKDKHFIVIVKSNKTLRKKIDSGKEVKGKKKNEKLKKKRSER